MQIFSCHSMEFISLTARHAPFRTLRWRRISRASLVGSLVRIPSKRVLRAFAAETKSWGARAAGSQSFLTQILPRGRKHPRRLLRLPSRRGFCPLCAVLDGTSRFRAHRSQPAAVLVFPSPHWSKKRRRLEMNSGAHLQGVQDDHRSLCRESR